MKWSDAIIWILQNNVEEGKLQPMHYVDITKAIIENKLREVIGKTPQNSVSSKLTSNPGDKYFISLGGGYFSLNEAGQKYSVPSNQPSNKKAESKEDKDPKVAEDFNKSQKEQLIKAFGVYWQRDFIDWAHPKLLGVQEPGADTIDFSEMRGIYLLYDGREIIYVGQAAKQSILYRLKAHTEDRLAGRWTRFAWFGIDLINPNSGKVEKIAEDLNIKIFDLLNALEGILIEGLEPRQNRKQGNKFGDEYIQYIDEDLQTKKALDTLHTKFGSHSK